MPAGFLIQVTPSIQRVWSDKEARLLEMDAERLAVPDLTCSDSVLFIDRQTGRVSMLASGLEASLAERTELPTQASLTSWALYDRENSRLTIRTPTGLSALALDGPPGEVAVKRGGWMLDDLTQAVRSDHSLYTISSSGQLVHYNLESGTRTIESERELPWTKLSQAIGGLVLVDGANRMWYLRLEGPERALLPLEGELLHGFQYEVAGTQTLRGALPLVGHTVPIPTPTALQHLHSRGDFACTLDRMGTLRLFHFTDDAWVESFRNSDVAQASVGPDGQSVAFAQRRDNGFELTVVRNGLTIASGGWTVEGGWVFPPTIAGFHWTTDGSAVVAWVQSPSLDWSNNMAVIDLRAKVVRAGHLPIPRWGEGYSLARLSANEFLLADPSLHGVLVSITDRRVILTTIEPSGWGDRWDYEFSAAALPSDPILLGRPWIVQPVIVRGQPVSGTLSWFGSSGRISSVLLEDLRSVDDGSLWTRLFEWSTD